MRGLASEEKGTSREEETRGVSLNEEEDRVAEHIRNEAIKTWNMEKKLGLVCNSSDEEVIKNLMEAKRIGSSARAGCEENQNFLSS